MTVLAMGCLFCWLSVKCRLVMVDISFLGVGVSAFEEMQ